MYAHCIFCSHALGRNETIETFPVGKVVAFDGWKGRLWAVCPRCGRWNLAPIEERWEAVERAEQAFRDTRLRVQGENVGVAQLPEGTRLIRVGDALPGEVAAWRYGSELRGRRRRYQLDVAFQLVASAIAPESVLLVVQRRRRTVLHRVAAAAPEDGADLLVRQMDMAGARLRADAEGVLHLSLTLPGSAGRIARWLHGPPPPREIALSGTAAHDLLARTLVRVNAPGAAGPALRRALEAVDRHGSVERILEREAGGELVLAERRWSLTRALHGRTGPGDATQAVPSHTMLALEMLLHEQTEREAMEGELDALEARWREAEEIAAIADALLDPLPPRRNALSKG
jgi:hypothetical protein